MCGIIPFIEFQFIHERHVALSFHHFDFHFEFILVNKIVFIYLVNIPPYFTAYTTHNRLLC